MMGKRISSIVCGGSPQNGNCEEDNEIEYMPEGSPYPLRFPGFIDIGRDCYKSILIIKVSIKRRNGR